MHYPPEFSNKARAAVEAATITSLRLHDERGRQWKSDWQFPERQSLATCILTIFLAYARAAIELGTSGIWSVDRVRTQALEGLRLITIGICFKRNYHYFIESGGGGIRYETQREFEATAEWRDFEDEILTLAAREGAGSPEAETGDRATTEKLNARGSYTPADLVSWGGLRAAFEEGAAEYDDLSAEYDSLYPGEWILLEGSPRSHRKFQDLAASAVAKLSASNHKSNGAPWQLWLGYMWAEGWRRPEILPSTPKAPIPQRGRPWPILKRMIERDDRNLWQVFKTSADCCRDLEEREQIKETTEPIGQSSSTLRPTEVTESMTGTAPKNSPASESEIGKTVPDANVPPAQTMSPGFAPSRRSSGSVAVFTDPRYPPPDIRQEAYPLIKEALKAWGFKGSEPENAFWNRWLDQCNWHGETNFLRASIKHCRDFAGHLLGDSREDDAAVFARVALALEKLRDKADARLNDLIARQVNPEARDKPTEIPAAKPIEGTPEERLAQSGAAHSTVDRSMDSAPPNVPPEQSELERKPFVRDPLDDPALRPLLWSRFLRERTSKTSAFVLSVANNHVSLSIPAPHTHRDVVARIAKEFQIPIESLADELEQPIFTRGQVIHNYLGDALDAIAREYPLMRWWVSEGGLNMAIVSSDEARGSDSSALISERAARRQAVVMPILTKKGWKRGRLVTKAGVGKNSVYEYLDGTRATITDDNRKAIAQALGLDADELPV